MKSNILKCMTLAMLLSACTDDINEVAPEDRLEINDFFSSPSDFRAALGGAFQQIQNYYALELLVLGDIPTDNVIQAQTGRLSNDVYWDWRYTSNNDIGLLDEAYEAINIANLIIRNLEALPDGPDKDNFEGQAKVIRALAHFDMVRVYGQIPTQSAGANQSLGVAYIKYEDGDADDVFTTPSRELVSDNYQEIVNDLISALTLVNNSSIVIENNFTIEAINGLLSRVYLYMGDYQKAINAASNVTKSVTPRADLLNTFRDAVNGGILMKAAINQLTDNLSPGVVWSQSSSNSTVSEYAIAYDLFTSIANDDIRKTAYVFQGVNEGNLYNAINKWLGEQGQINGQTDMPVIRVAEVLLNKAEAQFMMGQEAQARATLDQLRDERYMTYAGGETGQALADAIEYEKRLEFFAEYHRFFDLKRKGRPVMRSNAGDLADGSGTPPQEAVLDAGDYRFQLPIPQSELQVNPNFVQNPGYTSGS